MTDPNPMMRLDLFRNPEFSRGASRLTEMVWILISGLLVASWLPGSFWRVLLMRAFGAQIGQSVVIKPGVSVKFPWRLRVGDHVWIGERVWIDNLAEVTIGSHSCLSQGAYLCTGSHDWTDPHFGLVTRPIAIGRGCWVGALACLAPGTVLEDGAVLGMTTLGAGRISGRRIHRPDGSTRPRVIRTLGTGDT